MHHLIKHELDNLMIQFPNQSQINLDQYSQLYNINRRNASQHLKRRKIPSTKEGREVYISILDLATYKARCKIGGETLILNPAVKPDMKSRRGLNQMADNRQLSRGGIK